jgi:hypothetical protein
LGTPGGLLFQLLAALLIPDPLNLGPFFHRHSASDPTLLGGFLFLRSPALTLPIRHTFSKEFRLVWLGDVLRPCLPQALLLILLAQHPLVRARQGGLSRRRVAGKQDDKRDQIAGG